MKKMMRAFLVDPAKSIAGPIDVEDDINVWYKLLDCDIVDVVHRRIGDYFLDIICDDEGLFKAEQYISAIDVHGHAALVGAILVLAEEEVNNDEGDFRGLTDEEIAVLQAHIGRVKWLKKDGWYRSNICLVDLDY